MIKPIKYGCGEKLIYADSDIGKKNFKYVRIGIDKVDKIYKIFADANFNLIPSGRTTEKSLITQGVIYSFYLLYTNFKNSL